MQRKHFNFCYNFNLAFLAQEAVSFPTYSANFTLLWNEVVQIQGQCSVLNSVTEDTSSKKMYRTSFYHSLEVAQKPGTELSKYIPEGFKHEGLFMFKCLECAELSELKINHLALWCWKGSDQCIMPTVRILITSQQLPANHAVMLLLKTLLHAFSWGRFLCEG